MSRYYKLTLHFQASVASLSTFLISAGSHPIVLSPCLAGYPIGFLNYVLSTDHQTALNVCLISYTIGANIFLFYLRYEALHVDGQIKKFKCIQYFLFFFHFNMFYVLITIVGVLFRTQNKEEERENCAQRYTGDREQIYFEKTIFLTFFRTGTPCALFLLLVVLIILTYAFTVLGFAIMTRQALARMKTKVSVQSLRKHVVLINILYTQTIAQAVLVSAPLIFFIFLITTEVNIPNAHNYCFAVIAFSNIAGPIYVLYSMPGYRRAIIGLFYRTNKCEIQTVTKTF